MSADDLLHLEMKNLWRPCDDLSWNEAVSRAYNLKNIVISDGPTELKFVQAPQLIRGSYLATGAYATDGGESGLQSASVSVIEQVESILRKQKASFAVVKSRDTLSFEHPSVSVDPRYFTLVLDLQNGVDEVWTKRVHSKTRNQTRKSQKQGLTIRDGREDLLNDFYQVLSEAWRDLGTPTHSKNFYMYILEAFGEKAYLKVIYHRKVPIAAALIIGNQDTVHHPFAATLNRYKSLSVNNLLYWSIIEDACAKSVRYFDMGRSQRGQGTFSYKEGWGATVVPLYYTIVSLSGPPKAADESPVNRFLSNAWKKMPLVLTNALGPKLIKSVM